MRTVVELICREIAKSVVGRVLYDAGDDAGSLVYELSRVAYHDYLDFLDGWVDPEEGPDDECT